MPQQVNVYKRLKLFPGAIAEGIDPLFNNKQCRTYYVNNITGSSTASGLSWEEAVDEVDAALLLSETQRIKGATYNKVGHNRIIIQGTETAYEKIDQDANCVDIFGLGHRAHMGGAAGDVMISGAGAADGMVMSQLVTGWDTTVDHGGGLGVNVYNVHFEASGNFYAVDLVDWLLGSFEDCYFMTSGDSNYGGLHASEHFAGSLVRNCTAGGDAGSTRDGFYFTGGVWNQNLIEGCWSNAIRYGFFVDDYLQGGTVVRGCQFYGGTYGLYDNSAETTLLGLALYCGNYCSSAGTGMEVTNGGTYRCIGNWIISAGTADWLTTIAKS
jgi:hypothetical protein